MAREPLLAVRRNILAILHQDDEVGASWADFARAARKAGHDATAQSAIMQAERFGASMAHLERAKLMWAVSAERHDALRLLREYIEEVKSTAMASGTAQVSVVANPQMYVKTLVRYWTWVQETGLHPTLEVIEEFKRDAMAAPQHTGSEKVQFVLGQFYDTLVFPDRGGRSRYEVRDPSSDKGNGSVVTNVKLVQFLPNIVKHYADSLKVGHKHIFQSLPRLLTLWFENSTNDKVSTDIKEKLNMAVRRMSKEVPSYTWLSVFPQLVSRICHPEPRVLECLKQIIAQVLSKHPKEALWAFVAVIKSTQSARSKPAKQILELVYKITPDNRAWRDAAKEFLGSEGSPGIVSELMKVCNITTKTGNPQGKKKTLTMRGDCRALYEMAPRSSVLVPIQAMLTPAFPSSGLSESGHNPFPDTAVTIQAFGDKIDVMASLMSPVVIRIIGSDGKQVINSPRVAYCYPRLIIVTLMVPGPLQYKFLCKPKDDLRKDSRMMDFNSVWTTRS